jgi:hypothetical protein
MVFVNEYVLLLMNVIFIINVNDFAERMVEIRDRCAQLTD